MPTALSTRIAAVACAAYLVIAFVLGGRVPLFEWGMFRFPVTQAEAGTVTPIFLADGAVASIEDYVGFQGIGPDDVDIEHRPYECSVEHKLHEAKGWLTEHAAAPDAPPGPVRAEFGLLVLRVEDGRVVTERRIDAVGTAHPK